MVWLKKGFMRYLSWSYTMMLIPVLSGKHQMVIHAFPLDKGSVSTRCHWYACHKGSHWRLTISSLHCLKCGTIEADVMSNKIKLYILKGFDENLKSFIHRIHKHAQHFLELNGMIKKRLYAIFILIIYLFQKRVVRALNLVSTFHYKPIIVWWIWMYDL
jgi:hypothetical protein